MPDLGPSPAPAPQTPEQTEQLRLANADLAWKQVISEYPAAVRPSASFQGYISQATEVAVLTKCYTDHDVANYPDYPVGAKKGDKPHGVVPEISNEEGAIGLYICQVEHPYPPTLPPTPEQLGWLYDYLTKFLVPCYQANGVTNPPPPSREEFVAKWPNQGWYPDDGGGADPERIRVITEVCPPPK